MQSTKAKLEVGPFKFDFEGDDDAVTRKMEWAQPLIQAWLEKGPTTATIAAAPTKQEAPKATREETPATTETPTEENSEEQSQPINPSLSKIFKNGKRLTLLTRPTPDKALLLLMYGYKLIQKQDVVGSAQMALSFEETGITGVNRLIRVAKPLEQSGFISISGQKKGTRYVLTNAGIAEAEKILGEQPA